MHTTHTVTYDNGFTFLYRVSPAAPVLALDLWVAAGSADETPAQAGIAHVVEHMLFKGTERRAVGVIAAEVEALGGEINAFTSFDQTVYTLALSSRFAREGIDILHDALAHSRFDAAELALEQQVICEEIKRGRDSPRLFLSQTLFSTAFGRHPYGNPVIGTRESVTGFTREDLLGFVRTWYCSGNMTLVAVGDLPVDAVEPLVAATFGRLPRRAPPHRPDRPEEPARERFTYVAKPREVAEVYFDLAFPAPSARDGDAPALDLLMAVAGHGESSRLQTTVKLDRNLVHSVGAGAYLPRDPGLLYVSGVAAPALVAEALDAIAAELGRLAREPVAQEELDGARDLLEAELVFQRETAQSQAQSIGFNHAIFQNPEHDELFLTRLRALTPADLRRVAARYFTPAGAMVCLLHPKGGRAPLTAAKARALVRKGLDGTPAKGAGDRRFTKAKGRGVTVLCRRNDAVPIIALRAALPGGSRLDPAGGEGAHHLMAACLTRGSALGDVYEIARRNDAIGGELSGFSGRNSYGVKAQFHARHLKAALALMADVLTSPRFDEEEVAKSRSDALSQLRRRKDNPAGLVFRRFESLLFGRHPYANDPLGTVASVESLTGADLAALHRGALARGGLRFGAAGDFDLEAMAALVADALPALGDAPARLPRLPAPARPRRRRDETMEGSFEQAHIVAGFPGLTVRDRDRAPLKVINALLSGQGGRLFRRLRDEKGLAYSVTSLTMEGIERGYVAGYIATSHERAAEAREGLLAEMDRVARGEFTEQELRTAQRKLAGHYELGLQENGVQAAHMALDDLFGLDYRSFLTAADEVMAVSQERAREVAARLLDVERAVTVTLTRN